MIIFRYLAREIFSTLTAVTGVLLLIFLSNQFIRYLAKAAAGKLPGRFVLHLMMLEIPNLLGLLLPLGLFLAIIIAFGRLYAENEMTVLAASGLSRKRLIQMTLGMALSVAALVSFFSLYVGPHVAADRGRLLAMGASASIIDTIIPGRFQTTNHGKQVIYVEQVTRDRRHVQGLFAAQQVEPDAGTPHRGTEWNVITANSGQVVDKQALAGQFFVAQNGQRYRGVAGEKNFEVAKFTEYGVRLAPPPVPTDVDIRGIATSALWPPTNLNKDYAAEFQWRVSIPLMALILAFIAVPLSRIKPRQGKYAKILPAALVLISYANMMFVVRNWLRDGSVSPAIGMWGLHLAFVAFGVWLLLLPKLHFYFRRWLRHTS